MSGILLDLEALAHSLENLTKLEKALTNYELR